MAPVTIGLGGHPEADYIALTWSDGVSQTEISLAPSTPHKIEETQRQLASCPVIFTWDGEQYRFVSDVLGVGGLGFFSTPGVSAKPRPFERFLLPADALQPRDGRYQVKLTEPMEENAYLDQVYLEAVDVPRGWNVTLDERMSTAEPHATGRVITWRDYSLPTLAIDATGNDVTQLVTAADRHAPEPGSVDTRFIGLLANEQTLTLEFEEPLQRENAVLLAEGWVEYPYSQTVFAAWQAGIRYQTATLEAKGDTGDWVTVAAEFGYPAGMPRPMALPLPKLPEGTRTLRLRSNMEIYWDLLQVVYEENIDFQTQRREPAVAHISKIGFPKEPTAHNVFHITSMTIAPRIGILSFKRVTIQSLETHEHWSGIRTAHSRSLGAGRKFIWSSVRLKGPKKGRPAIYCSIFAVGQKTWTSIPQMVKLSVHYPLQKACLVPNSLVLRP